MSEPTCLNLAELYGDRYRITWDPAYDPRHVPQRLRDPWYMQIPCAGRGVTIYPYGSTVLALQCDYRPGVARQIAAIPGVRLHQDGSGEKTFLFDVALFDQVAAIVKPRKRRRLSEEHKERLRQANAPYRFSAQRCPGEEIEA